MIPFASLPFRIHSLTIIAKGADYNSEISFVSLKQKILLLIFSTFLFSGILYSLHWVYLMSFPAWAAPDHWNDFATNLGMTIGRLLYLPVGLFIALGIGFSRCDIYMGVSDDQPQFKHHSLLYIIRSILLLQSVFWGFLWVWLLFFAF